MEFTRFLTALGLFFAFFSIQNSTGQIALQTDSDLTGLHFKNELQNPPVLKDLSKIPPSTGFNDPSLPWRLPQNVRPYHYSLVLTPILESGHEQAVGLQWTTPGSVNISVTALEDTSSITLHTRNLTIQELVVKDGDTVLQINGTNYDVEYMHFTINLDTSLVAGQNYTIYVKFIALIQIELHGLYRSSYLDPNTNETKWIAVTQMEALNARELFPCFDESSFKAVFEVVIGRLEKHLALANAQSIGNTTEGVPPGWVLESFAKTVPMSTYLFAMLISEFEYSEAEGVILPEVVVRTYSPKHFIDRQGGVYASEKSEKVLRFYGDYFGEEYPMAKMDMASVPAFFFGAMENFGLNIYREDALLYFPDESTESERLRITTVIAHELAHQWFGNLVSPAFWTHAWLNEGLASYVEYIGIEELSPEFNGWDLFVTDSIQAALQTDGVDTHPLKIGEVEWYGRGAMDWFDGIQYEKGGSVMRMVEGFVTEPVMRKGLSRYQTRMKYLAAIQDDLFQDLGVEAELANKLPTNVSMKDILDTWTLQTGFPLLEVTRSGENNVVTQSKFGNATSTSRWIVPISYASQDNPDFDPEPEVWLTEESTSISEPISSWVIFNAGATGFYRVKYDSNIEPQISEQLEANHTVINHRSRSQLLDDYFTFAWRELGSVVDALDFTKYLATSPEAEVEYIVWKTLLKHLQKSYNLFSSTEIYADFKKYILPRINRAIEATGGANAIDIDSKGMVVSRHTLLLDWACGMADPMCFNYASELLKTWEADVTISPVPRDLRPTVYCAAVANGSLDAFAFMYQRYEEPGITAKQQTYFLNSLACATEPALLNLLLTGTLNDAFFQSKAHSEAILRRIAGNAQARQTLINFLTENVQNIITHFGSPSPIVGAFAELSKYMSTARELAQLENFIENNQGTFGQSLDSYVNTTRQNIAWVNEFGSVMQSFFTANP